MIRVVLISLKGYSFITYIKYEICHHFQFASMFLTVTSLFSSKDDVCMHLTNYAINKHSENFVHDDDRGSKRYTFSLK